MKKIATPRTLTALLAVAALTTALAGCAPVVLGGIAMGGFMAVDRRTAGTQVEDERIELQAVNQIHGKYTDTVHINVTSYNRQVLLTGEVPAAQALQAIETIVGGIQGVKSVVNELAVMPSSSLSTRSGDTFVTGKVRASLVDAKDLAAGAFKVVTERSVVYLMGRVTQREAQRASDIARGVSGVSKVVRVFDYLTEDELVRLNVPRQAPVTTDAAPSAVAPATVAPAAAAPATVAPAAAVPITAAPVTVTPIAPRNNP